MPFRLKSLNLIEIMLFIFTNTLNLNWELLRLECSLELLLVPDEALYYPCMLLMFHP